MTHGTLSRSCCLSLCCTPAYPPHFRPLILVVTKPFVRCANMRLICTTNKAYSPDLHVFELQCNWVVRSARRCPSSLPLRRRFPSSSARFLFAAVSVLSPPFHPPILLLLVLCARNGVLECLPSRFQLFGVVFHLLDIDEVIRELVTGEDAEQNLMGR